MTDEITRARQTRAEKVLADHHALLAKADAATAAIVRGGEHAYTTRVHVIDGEVYIALPHDQYIKMTPAQARQVGGRLLLKAAEALGEPAPKTIILNVED